MATAKCKGNSRQVNSVDDIVEFARENGYSQFIVLQDGNKVSPSSINFNDGEIQILPYDKWASVSVKVGEYKITVPDGSSVEIKDKNHIAVNVIEPSEEVSYDDYEEDEPDTSEAYEEDEPDTSGWL